MLVEKKIGVNEPRHKPAGNVFGCQDMSELVLSIQKSHIDGV